MCKYLLVIAVLVCMLGGVAQAQITPGVGICPAGEVVVGLVPNGPPKCGPGGGGGSYPGGSPPQIGGFAGLNTSESETVSGDCTFTRAAAGQYTIACVKTNGTAFGTAATVNTGTSGATIPLLNGANTWSGVQTYTNSDIAVLGSSTGATTITSANTGASNFTLTIPAATGTVAELNQTQTFSGTNTFSTAPVMSGASITAATIPTGSMATVQGNGAKVQLSTGTTTTGDSAEYDANGNVIDSGSALNHGVLVNTCKNDTTITATGSGTFTNACVLTTSACNANDITTPTNCCTVAAPGSGSIVVTGTVGDVCRTVCE